LQRLAGLAVRLVPDSVCWITLSTDGTHRLLACSEAPPADLSWHLALARQAAREPCVFADLRAAATGAAARGRSGPFRFFAGAPLLREDGQRIGAVCLLARVPRPGQETRDRALLHDLAAIAVPHALPLSEADPRRATAEQLHLRTEQLLEACRLARIRTWELALGDAGSEAALHAAFGPVHPDDRALVRDAIRSCTGSEAAFDIEFRVLRPDRRVGFVRAAGRCHLDAAGVPDRLSGVCQDITERKETEAASLQTEKLKSIGRLTGGIAHDFNNLLTVISMNLEMLAELVPRDHEFWEYIEPARQAAASGAELTTRLLAFAQRQPLRPERVWLERFLRSLRELAVRTIGGRCTIELACAPDIGTCLVDRAQLESALLNLIANARDAMPAGGRIVIGAANTSIGAEGRDGLAPGEYVSISVTDEGIGVPREILDRVFEPFFTTKPVGKGTGLGLSMVLGFAKQSGGRVEITSRPGAGTVVVLHLPRAAGQGANESDSDANEEWSPQPLRTLVVDDAPDVLHAMTRLCRDIGLQPVPAESAEEAIGLLRSDMPFDLLLTDVVLPGRFGGAEIAREGRRARPRLRVLFTSGYLDAEIVNRARIDSGSEVLIKPFSRAQLLAALRRVMEARAA
jgi:signal transduction histidine kinase/ActR/RegA family two-component response regulator